MKQVMVVAAVIRSQRAPGCVLATARGYGPYQGQWEFPGGKVEPGETPQQALRREIREELEAEITVQARIGVIKYDYPDFHLCMDCYWCDLLGEHLVLKEALGAKWLSREHLRDVPWLPADRLLIPKIEKGLEE